jgi:hypothetical protein
VFTLLLSQLFLVSYYSCTLSVQSKHTDNFCCSWQMVCLDCQIFPQVLWFCRISYADIINIKILHFLYLLHKQQDIIFVVLISNMVRHCFLSISYKWWDILFPTLVLWQVHDRQINNYFLGLSSYITVNSCLHYKNPLTYVQTVFM